MIGDFVDRTSDGMPTPYFIRVVGDANRFDLGSDSYSLVVTKGADFETEPNDELGQEAQDITTTGIVLGAVASGLSGSGSDDSAPGEVTLGTELRDGEGFRWDISRNGSIDDGTNDAYDGGLIHGGFPELPRANTELNGREIVIGPATVGNVRVERKIYVPADQGFARYLEIVTNESASPVQYRLDLHSNLGSDGATRLIGSSIDDGRWDAQDDWVVTDDARQIVNFKLSGADTDFYRFDADAGDTLLVQMQVPADGSGQFVNNLDPALELYDPDGSLVASRVDGPLTYAATVTGTYVVRVEVENGTSGEYVLRVVSAPVGDMNLDGHADLDDVEGFVLALEDPAGYEARYGLPPSLLGDTDGDSDLDFDDIPGFVVGLNGTLLPGGSPAVAVGGGLDADAADWGQVEVGGWVTVEPARTMPAAAVRLDEMFRPSADLVEDLAATSTPAFSRKPRTEQDWASWRRLRARHSANPPAVTDEELAAVWSANEDWRRSARGS